MKKNIKISIIALVVAILSIGIIAYAAEIEITPPCYAHTFSVVSIDEATVTYACVDCGEEETKTKQEVTAMWDIECYNTLPCSTDVNNSSYLDLCKDNFINAKDFAVIYRFCK